jgi:hypothetical protein
MRLGNHRRPYRIQRRRLPQTTQKNACAGRRLKGRVEMLSHTALSRPLRSSPCTCICPCLRLRLVTRWPRWRFARRFRIFTCSVPVPLDRSMGRTKLFARTATVRCSIAGSQRLLCSLLFLPRSGRGVFPGTVFRAFRPKLVVALRRVFYFVRVCRNMPSDQCKKILWAANQLTAFWSNRFGLYTDIYIG